MMASQAIFLDCCHWTRLWIFLSAGEEETSLFSQWPNCSCVWVYASVVTLRRVGERWVSRWCWGGGVHCTLSPEGWFHPADIVVPPSSTPLMVGFREPPSWWTHQAAKHAKHPENSWNHFNLPHILCPVRYFIQLLIPDISTSFLCLVSHYNRVPHPRELGDPCLELVV